MSFLSAALMPDATRAQTPPPLASPQPPAPQEPTAETSRTSPVPQTPQITIHSESGLEMDGTYVRARLVTISYIGATITADRAEGDLNQEIVLSGNAKIVSRGLTSYADAIHFFPKDRSYHLENPRGVLDPETLRNQVLEPFRVRGNSIRGNRAGYGLGQHLDATPCIEQRPHYEMRIRSAELIPNRRLTLKRVALYFFGQKLIVLPSLVIPLDRRETSRLRADYLPEFGRNINEGYYARFPYAFAVGSAAASFLRLDITEKRGLGYRVEQEYSVGKQDSSFDTANVGNNAGPRFDFTNLAGGSGAVVSAYGYGNASARLARLGTGLGPTNGGLFAMQGYFGDGLSRNFNASFRHQQSLDRVNRFGVSTELSRNSFFTFTDQSSQNSRLFFNHNDPAHGVNAETSLTYATNDSGNFRTSQFTGTYRHAWEFASLGQNRNNLSLDVNLTRNINRSENRSSRTARLNSEVRFQHVSRDYSFSLQANRNLPVGPQSDNNAFGTLERFPELQFSTNSYDFQRGWLKRVPLTFDFGFGYFSEPGSNTRTSRTLLGLTLQESSLLRGNTEIVMGGGFEQRLYGDGAAQYILRNAVRLRQRLGGRSGFDLNYQYQEPAGGTSFLFDTFGRSHFLAAEGGYLDDSRFQLTARVGYDFLGASRERPWQTLSTRMMWRPNNHTRLDVLATYDPNTSRFFAVTQSLRLRGRNDFALDVLARYDPAQGRFSQVNGQFDLPFGRSWRVAGLLRYNGFNGRFESTNLQLTHRWDCMEASLTYTETPLGFRNEQQLFFSIRLTAFPFFRSFGRGPAGNALGPGLGELF